MVKPRETHNIKKKKDTQKYGSVALTHPKLGEYHLYFEKPEKWLFTNNETNKERLYGQPNESPYVKDLFNHAVIENDFELTDAVNEGSKFAPMFQEVVESGKSVELRLRFSKKELSGNPLTTAYDTVFNARLKEADEFYHQFDAGTCTDTANIQRQAFAGMLWSKQYFNIDMETWMNGDPGQPEPPQGRKHGRNKDWLTLNNEDIVSMPDKWEYPWYAVWDLAFHTVPLAMVDAEFAKNQLVLILREWYMAPSGQIPAYEWAFSDVNPPVHAWAAFKVYEIDKKKTGKGDIDFLKRIFNKLSLNFTWWVNRKDHNDNNIFEGGFLGLDNIGVFDRSNEIPGGGHLEQADGTAWMAMFSLNMLQIALEIAIEDNSYEDMCTKYFEHFVYISESLEPKGRKLGRKLGRGTKGSSMTSSHCQATAITFPSKCSSLVGLMTLNSVLGAALRETEKGQRLLRMA